MTEVLGPIGRAIVAHIEGLSPAQERAELVAPVLVMAALLDGEDEDVELRYEAAGRLFERLEQLHRGGSVLTLVPDPSA